MFGRVASSIQLGNASPQENNYLKRYRNLTSKQNRRFSLFFKSDKLYRKSKQKYLNNERKINQELVWYGKSAKRNKFIKIYKIKMHFKLSLYKEKKIQENKCREKKRTPLKIQAKK